MKSYKQLIKIVSIPASAIAICFGVVSCGTKEYKAKESWTIMVYMCGSDLESRSGLASMDLIEMMNANIPTNFQILVETGGAENWFNTTSSPIRNDAIQRWRIGHKKMDLISELPLVSMADGSTLTDFLEWGMLEAKHVKSQHIASILWDHGGGWSGVCSDNSSASTSDKPCLYLNDLHDAFNSAINSQHEYDKFDIIGFDACLMAELEVYYAIADFTNYIVASEELEPGYGWEYTSLIKETYEHASNSMAVAGGWVNSFKQFYSVNFPNEQATLSALNMHYWNDFDGLFQSWIEMSSWLEDGFRSDAKDSTITTQFGKQVSEPLGFTTVDLDMIVNKCGGSDDSFRREIDKLFKKGLVINKWSSNQTQYDNISGLSIGVPDDTNPLCTQAQYYPNVYNGSNWNWSEQHLKNYFIKLGLLI